MNVLSPTLYIGKKKQCNILKTNGEVGVRGGMSAAFISLEDVICKDSIATNGQVIS
jgi:hypothetical protein